MPERFDQLILSLFTKFSHWFQILTGKNNLFLARLALMEVALSVAVCILDYWFPDLLSASTPIIMVVVFFLTLIFMWQHIHLLIEYERKSENPSDVLYQVPLPISRKYFELARCVFFGLFLFLEIPVITIEIITWKRNFIFELMLYTTFFFLAATCYFIDVTPLPRGKSKIRKWLEGLSFKAKPSYAPNR